MTDESIDEIDDFAEDDPGEKIFEDDDTQPDDIPDVLDDDDIVAEDEEDEDLKDDLTGIDVDLGSDNENDEEF